MTNRQIQPANRDVRLAPRGRPRGVLGQVWTSVLQPGYFYRTMPPMADTRQWLWVAVLILALTGFGAVRQEALKNGDSGGSSSQNDFVTPPGTDLGGDFGGGGAVFDPGFSGAPTDFGGVPTTGTDTSASDAGISRNLTIAVINSAGIILGWAILAVLLSEVTLFNGQLPSLGQNLQVAIWTSVPLALMAGLQLVFYAAGGTVGEPGISGLLKDWPAYETLPQFLKSVVLSLTTHLTLFWVWSLMLLYVGARQALNGKRWAVLIVVVIWAVVVVIVPVLSGAIAAPEPAVTDAPTGDSLEDIPFDLGLEDPSAQIDQMLQSGTLPPELQQLFSVDATAAALTPEGTGEPFVIVGTPLAPLDAGDATAEAGPSAGVELFVLGPESTEPPPIAGPGPGG
jgi:hypothetical protein